jgi:hypothetical protein
MQLNPPGFFSPKISGIVIEGDNKAQKSRLIVAVRISVLLRHVGQLIDAQEAEQKKSTSGDIRSN